MVAGMVPCRPGRRDAQDDIVAAARHGFAKHTVPGAARIAITPLDAAWAQLVRDRSCAFFGQQL